MKRYLICLITIFILLAPYFVYAESEEESKDIYIEADLMVREDLSEDEDMEDINIIYTGGSIGEHFNSGVVLEKIQKRGTPIYQTPYGYMGLDLTGLLTVFREATENMDNSIDVSSFNIPVEQALNVYEILCYCSPKSYYLTRVDGVFWFGYWVNEDGYLERYYPIYAYFDTFNKLGYSVYYADTSYNVIPGAKEALMPEIEANRLAFDAVISEMQDIASKKTTDFEKLLAYHDYIVKNFEYNEADWLEQLPEDRITNNIMYFILNKSSVCASYASLYNYVLMEEGYETGLISCVDSNGVPLHIWNMVKLSSSENNYEAKWYQIDVTWDDNTKVFDKGNMSNEYFLLSERAIRESRTKNGSYYVAPSLDFGTEYDDADWHNSYTDLVEIDGDYYYMVIEDGMAELRKLHTEYGVVETLYTYPAMWYTEDWTSYYVSCAFGGLVLKNNRLYFNDSLSIMAYNLKTNTVRTMLLFSTTGSYQISSLYLYNNEVVYGVSRDYVVYGLEGVIPLGIIEPSREEILVAAKPVISGDTMSVRINTLTEANVNVYIDTGDKIYKEERVINGTENIMFNIPDISTKNYRVFIWDDNLCPYTEKYVHENITEETT